MKVCEYAKGQDPWPYDGITDLTVHTIILTAMLSVDFFTIYAFLFKNPDMSSIFRRTILLSEAIATLWIFLKIIQNTFEASYNLGSSPLYCALMNSTAYSLPVLYYSSLSVFYYLTFSGTSLKMTRRQSIILFSIMASSVSLIIIIWASQSCK